MFEVVSDILRKTGGNISEELHDDTVTFRHEKKTPETGNGVFDNSIFTSKITALYPRVNKKMKILFIFIIYIYHYGF